MGNELSVKLNWIKETQGQSCGVTWGVPWSKGELKRDDALSLQDPEGNQKDVQSWPTAYWPDGSVKWTAHAASLDKALEGEYSIHKENAKPYSSTLTITETEDQIEIDTGAVRAIIGKNGSAIIRELYRDGQLICTEGKLICMREERRSPSGGGRITLEEEYESRMTRVTVEQQGAVRAVVLAEGSHRAAVGDREWLPFKLRMYFYVNQDSIRFTHTFLYDGNAQKDFIKGLGVSFTLPMTGPLYNRHVRFAGETGCFSESPKHLATTRTTGKYAELHKQQQVGEYIGFDEKEDVGFLGLLEESAVWDSFKLIQESPDYYSIVKRTSEECSWLKAVSGNRAAGLAYLGDFRGGIAIGVRNFWEKYPSSIEMNGMAKDQAELKIWFWSPDAAAMDLRHYDTRTHVNSAYEGSEELRSSPYGVGNTNEFMLWCCTSTPKPEELADMVKQVQSPPLLLCRPERYHDTEVLGVWSLPDRSTPGKALIEDQLDALIDFYKKEVEQRKWYGFWDFGDFMHTYDPVRHTWRYDIGGFAWQNTELVPNMWLWTMFLRTGREDIFRMAEAMTRHTSEVDVYHIGEYAGLGSRHNVVHWGCGCKEARIAMAGLHKYYYYLTADERVGDLLTEVADADYATVTLDPMRSYFPKDDYPTHVRSGPDWSAFVSNWLVQWERFERTDYRDKILRGISNLKAMPYRLLSGTTFGYDPQTSTLHHISDGNYSYHMVVCFGAPQVWMELSSLLSDSVWDEMLVEFGAFYYLDNEQKLERTSGKIPGEQFHWPMFATAMTGFAAAKKQDAELAVQTWNYLLDQNLQGSFRLPLENMTVADSEFVRPIHEVPGLSTNVASQWSLNAIICLELISEWLPEPAAEKVL